jgi:hypothetical protein
MFHRLHLHSKKASVLNLTHLPKLRMYTTVYIFFNISWQLGDSPRLDGEPLREGGLRSKISEELMRWIAEDANVISVFCVRSGFEVCTRRCESRVVKSKASWWQFVVRVRVMNLALRTMVSVLQNANESHSCRTCSDCRQPPTLASKSSSAETKCLLCRIWDSQSAGHEQFYLLGYVVCWDATSRRRNISPPSSGSKQGTSMKQQWYRTHSALINFVFLSSCATGGFSRRTQLHGVSYKRHRPTLTVWAKWKR